MLNGIRKYKFVTTNRFLYKINYNANRIIGICVMMKHGHIQQLIVHTHFCF